MASYLTSTVPRLFDNRDRRLFGTFAVFALAMALATAGCNNNSSSQRTGAGGSAGGAGGSGGVAGGGGAGGSGDAGTDAAADAGSDATNAGPSCLPAGDAGATSPPDAGLVLVADTRFGFSGTQGACAWSYGYEVPGTDGVFHLMTDWDDGSPAWWTLRNTYWTRVGPDVQHANGTATSGGRSPVEQWSVRRWTSTVTGTVTISGSLRKSDGSAVSNGVDARIVVDGVTKYSQFIDGTDTVGVSFAVTAPVVAGSYVDFVLDPHLSNDLADTTFFAAQIWK
jgi:hypothetical protein